MNKFLNILIGGVSNQYKRVSIKHSAHQNETFFFFFFLVLRKVLKKPVCIGKWYEIKFSYHSPTMHIQIHCLVTKTQRYKKKISGIRASKLEFPYSQALN